MKTGKNLFNIDTVIKGKYVDEATGVLYSNASYDSSDYIPVLANTKYFISNTTNIRVAYYNAAKVFISGAYPVTSPITTPANTAFIRFSFATNNTPQLEQSEVATTYEKFGYQISKPLPKHDLISIFLPPEICIAVGRTIELYNRQVVLCGNINDYHVVWTCAVGKNMKRKWSCEGTVENIGNCALTCTVYNNDMEMVAKATSTVRIVSDTITSNKSILCIGDSLTNAKPWLSELRTLSGNMFTFVGTRGSSPLQHEGRSGFSAAQYLAATEYSFEGEGVHPFWDGTRFNWNYYKTNTGLNPDAVQIFLGTNGLEFDPTTNVGNIKQIVDYIRQDDATIPIFVVFTLYGGDQNGIKTSGTWKFYEDAKVFNLMVKLYELLNSYTDLYFIPISLAHDSEYNFGTVSTPVNPRASQTELLPAEATHPQTQGYMQFADIIFSVMAKYLN
jgi:lysophospholipase L1-like esterase